MRILFVTILAMACDASSSDVVEDGEYILDWTCVEGCEVVGMLDYTTPDTITISGDSATLWGETVPIMQEGETQVIGGVCLRWLDDVVCHVRLAWIRTGAPWGALVLGPEGAYLITYEVRATHR